MDQVAATLVFNFEAVPCCCLVAQWKSGACIHIQAATEQVLASKSTNRQCTETSYLGPLRNSTTVAESYIPFRHDQDVAAAVPARGSFGRYCR